MDLIFFGYYVVVPSAIITVKCKRNTSGNAGLLPFATAHSFMWESTNPGGCPLASWPTTASVFLPCDAVCDPGYRSRKIEKPRTDKFDTWNKHYVVSLSTHVHTSVNCWLSTVYTSYMTSQNLLLLHVSNVSVLNFRIFLLMYPWSMTDSWQARQSVQELSNCP